MKQRWFQIHLSTAIVMMLVSGALMMANTSRIHRGEYVEMPFEGDAYNRGFPWVACTEYESYYGLSAHKPREWNYGNAALNASIAIVAIFASFLFSESFIRRREARKP